MQANLIITTRTQPAAATPQKAAAQLTARREHYIAALTATALAAATERTPRRTGRLAQGFQTAEQTARFDRSTDTTRATATNTIRYAGYVEYGTRRMAARAMLRRAIAATIPAIPRLWSNAQTTP